MGGGGIADRTEAAVVIAGGGPTGLMLAAELALAGADVLVVERRADQHVDGARAGGLHARTLEVLDQRGIVERFLAAGTVQQIVGFGGIRLDIGDFPTRHPYGLALRQREMERLLADRVTELGVPIRRSCEVIGFTADDDGVDVALSDGGSVRAAYLVGCDGGRSTVRRAARIGFTGSDATTSWLVAELGFDDRPEVGVRPEGGGIGPIDADRPDGPYRAVLREPRVDEGREPSMADVRAALVAVYGTDFGAREATWRSRFTDAARQAVTYRQGRVLLAGDAAHVHPPQGGQGLNLGVQDAVNLGWKLAAVVAGTAPDELLGTYHDERHPVGAGVLRTTMAQVALAGADERHDALRGIVADLLATDEGRRRVAGMLSGLDVHYELGGDHPLVGRRAPDLDLTTAAGIVPLYSFLHDARPLLVDLGGPDSSAIDPVTGVRHVAASHHGRWDLPVLGPVAPPAALLVRPDGHVAWAGEGDDPGLRAALDCWFGAARPPAGGGVPGDGAGPAADPARLPRQSSGRG